MSKLYEDCPICRPPGRIAEGATCPSCDGRTVVDIGLTSRQLERLVADHDQLRLRSDPLAAVAVFDDAGACVEVHLCYLSHQAIEVSQRLAREGRRHTLYKPAKWVWHTAAR